MGYKRMGISSDLNMRSLKGFCSVNPVKFHIESQKREPRYSLWGANIVAHFGVVRVINITPYTAWSKA